MFRIAFCLYGVAIGFYVLRYNAGFDTGIPGYLAALPFELFGSLDERLTIWGTMLVGLIPFFLGAAIVGSSGRRHAKTDAPNWPANFIANGAIVAILAVSAYVFLSSELERQASAKIYRVNLNAGEKVPEGAEYVTNGRPHPARLSLCHRRRKEGGPRPIGKGLLALHRSAMDGGPAGRLYRRASLRLLYATIAGRHGTGRFDRRQQRRKNRGPAVRGRSLDQRGTCRRCARLRAEDHQKLADNLSLLDQTGFPDGKPQARYGDIRPVLPWLLPAGRPLGAALVLVGAVGLLRQRQQSPALAELAREPASNNQFARDNRGL